MGDRVSICFVNGDEKSVVLFSHWGGMEFVEGAKAYAKRLRKECGDKRFEPLDRREPDTVMVDFIRELTRGMDRVRSDIYLGKTEHDGDNSDNGHYEIDVSD